MGLTRDFCEGCLSGQGRRRGGVGGVILRCSPPFSGRRRRSNLLIVNNLVRFSSYSTPLQRHPFGLQMD